MKDYENPGDDPGLSRRYLLRTGIMGAGVLGLEAMTANPAQAAGRHPGLFGRHRRRVAPACPPRYQAPVCQYPPPTGPPPISICPLGRAGTGSNGDHTIYYYYGMRCDNYYSQTYGMSFPELVTSTGCPVAPAPASDFCAPAPMMSWSAPRGLHPTRKNHTHRHMFVKVSGQAYLPKEGLNKINKKIGSRVNFDFINHDPGYTSKPISSPEFFRIKINPGNDNYKLVHIHIIEIYADDPKIPEALPPHVFGFGQEVDGVPARGTPILDGSRGDDYYFMGDFRPTDFPYNICIHIVTQTKLI